jgi:outer membrane protein assembly factor BamB
MKAAVVAVFLAFLSFGSLAFAARPEATTLNSYPAYLGGPAHTSYVPTATAFTTANAEKAHSTWTWTPSGALNASPSVNAGVIYIGSERGDFYALNATTGAVKWTKKLTISNCKNFGIVSSASVAKDPVTGTWAVRPSTERPHTRPLPWRRTVRCSSPPATTTGRRRMTRQRS